MVSRFRCLTNGTGQSLVVCLAPTMLLNVSPIGAAKAIGADGGSRNQRIAKLQASSRDALTNVSL
jgi:hypothetical protein